MKTNRKSSLIQRKLLEKRVQPWIAHRGERVPPSGWLKAVRGALGINTRQLAARIGVAHAAVLQFEKREALGTVSIATVRKVARAMRCQLVYAIVPEEPFPNLESILDAQATRAAREVISRVDHTMRLEQQGLSAETSGEQVKDLAEKLKTEMAPTLWNESRSILDKRKPK